MKTKKQCECCDKTTDKSRDDLDRGWIGIMVYPNKKGNKTKYYCPEHHTGIASVFTAESDELKETQS